MRVLVTGASGFIGSALVPALIERGHEVRAAARDAALERELEGCDAVIHLANLAHGRFDRKTLWRVNVEGTRRLAQAAAARGVRRLVYLSSIKASGEETGSRPYDGTEAPAPQDEYGRTKLAAEQALAEEASVSTLQIVTLRPPLVYGPGVKANFCSLMRAIASRLPLPFASVQNRRSLLYVGNLVDAVRSCMETPQLTGNLFVVADRPALSTPELCRALGEALGRAARLFQAPVPLLELSPALRRLTRSLEVDDARFRSAFQWQPRYGLDEGLLETARWYLRR